MKRVVVAATVLLSAAAYAAPVSYTGSYSQNFNTVQAPAFVPTGTAQGTTGVYADGVTVPGWNLFAEGATTQFNTYLVSDGGTTTAQQNKVLNLGSSATFGSGAQTDRAFGAQTVQGTTGTVAAGTARAPLHYSVTLTNNSGATITNFALAYNAEIWRVPSNEQADTDGLTVDYKLGVTPTDANAAELAATGWTSLASANYTQTTAHTTVNQQLDGNLNQSSKSASISAISWANGTNLTIRWTDSEIDGSSNALNTVMGVDDVAITSTTPEPAALSLLGVAGAGLMRRRRV